MQLQNAAGVVIKTVVTNATGHFIFESVNAGDYAIVVKPPAALSLRFPSSRLANSFHRYDVETLESYGRKFKVEQAGRQLFRDIPLDEAPDAPPTFNALFIEKEAHRQRVERGDLLAYTVRVRNNLQQTATNVRVEDMLPPGVLYVPGSARAGRRCSMTQPGGRAPSWFFSLPDIAPTSTLVLSYVVEVGHTTGFGKKVNRARAIANYGDTDQRSSLTAQAVVGCTTVAGIPGRGKLDRQGIFGL